MLNHQRRPAINKRNAFLIIPVVVVFLLSLSLSLAPIVRYRNWSADLRLIHWVGFVLWIMAYAFLYKTIHTSFEKPRLILFASVQLIIGIGLIMIWRLNTFFGIKQSLWVVFCTLIAILLIKKNDVFEKVRRYKYLVLIVGLVLILLTFFFGTYPGGNGPRLWLGSRGIYFQPSELLKLILIFYLAAFFSEAPAGKAKILRNIFPTIILAFASIALLIFQRDLGTALIFISIYVLMVFAVYGRRRILLASFIILLIATIIGYAAIDLVRIRFESWVFPWYDPQTASYQIIQALIAVAAGGIFGTGIGLGYPNLIPLSHSDFIFSAIAEEFGLLGSIGLLCLFALVLFEGIRISLRAKDRYQRYLAIGITSYLIVQSILIIGGNIRLLPITGVTLPFISYGGSSLLVSYIGFAILIYIENNAAAQPKAEQKPYRVIATFFSVCLIAVAATLGWWGIVHANDIQLRDDNARNLIANLFVKRGEIFDRDNQLLAESTGNPGYLKRVYTYPSLSNTIGFFHQKYGLSGIEDAFDAYLRGQKGYPSQDIWYSYLLYDQPPEGRPIRLTIDTNLQEKADDLLQGQKGGLVVLDANNGEIISISTAPYFNANQLDENWVAWGEDESAPLINRVTQGAYPVGGLISPLLLAYEDQVGPLENYTGITSSYDRNDRTCNQPDPLTIDEGSFLQNGCAGTTLSIGISNSPYSYFSQVPLSTIFDTVEIGLAMSAPTGPSPDTTWSELFFGKNRLRSNPLQIARAFLPLSNQGYLVNPTIVSAVNTANAGWVVISNPAPRQAFSENKANDISALLTKRDEDYWEISAATRDASNTYFWYVAGTNNQQNGSSYIVTLVLEGASRGKALQIGQKLLGYLKEY